MTEREEKLQQLMKEISLQLNITIPPDFSYYNRKEILEIINGVKPDLFKKLYQLITIVEVYQFIRSDKELRLKAFGLWKTENERLGKELNQCVNDFDEYMTSLGMNLSFWVKQLNIELQN